MGIHGARAGGIAALLMLSMAAGAPLVGAGDGPATKPPAAPTGGGTVSGIVLDGDGKPLAGAIIEVYRPDAKKPFTTTSDAKGFYAVRNLPPGPAAVTIRAKGRISEQKEVTVPATGLAVVDGKLLPGVRFAGKVKSTRDEPVGDVEVMAVEDRGSGDDGVIAWFGRRDFGESTRTRADGTFELDGLAPGSRYKLKLSHDRFLPLELPGLDAEAGGGHDHVEAILEDAAWITGTIVDPSGKPVPEATVMGPGDGEGRTITFGNVTIYVSVGGFSGRTADAKGRFTLGSLEPGEEVKVRARFQGFFPGETIVKDLVAGQEKGGVVVKLEAATATVAGTVVDDLGKPVRGARVEAHGDDELASLGVSDATGRFTLLHVASHAPVRLTAEAEGYVGGHADEVALGSSDARLELKRLAHLRLVVVGEDGKPIARVNVRTLAEAGGRGAGGEDLVQGDKGVEMLLPLGTVELFVRAEGYEELQAGSFEVEPGATIDAGKLVLTKRPEKEKGGK